MSEVTKTKTIQNCSHYLSQFVGSHLPLLKKITVTSVGIFSLSIPVLYHRFYKTFRLSISLSPEMVLSEKISPPVYSEVGQQALKFAEKILEDTPHIKPTNWHRQPINPKISKLNAIFVQTLNELFQLLEKYEEEDPWEKKETLQIADKCIKLGFAVSNLTLDDLPQFIRNLPKEYQDKSYEKTLIRLDHYQWRTFFACPSAYSILRPKLNASTKGMCCRRYPGKHGKFVERNPQDPFYTEGTIQNLWNQLHNEYCDRIRQYVNEKRLNELDQRFMRCVQKDTPVLNWVKKDNPDYINDFFNCVPDTMPT